jgi:DNA-binding MurR/RpiR family transcriptional regulator
LPQCGLFKINLHPVSQTNLHLILESAKRTIELQAASIQHLTHFIDSSVAKAVETISTCKGRLVVSGIGKSAIVAQKIVQALLRFLCMQQMQYMATLEWYNKAMW